MKTNGKNIRGHSYQQSRSHCSIRVVQRVQIDSAPRKRQDGGGLSSASRRNSNFTILMGHRHTYTPDFKVLRIDGSIEIHEVTLLKRMTKENLILRDIRQERISADKRAGNISCILKKHYLRPLKWRICPPFLVSNQQRTTWKSSPIQSASIWLKDLWTYHPDPSGRLHGPGAGSDRLRLRLSHAVARRPGISVRRVYS